MNRRDLAYAGIAKQTELLRAREVSARELLELYLEGEFGIRSAPRERWRRARVAIIGSDTSAARTSS